MEDGAEQDAAEDHGDGTRVFYGSRPFFWTELSRICKDKRKYLAHLLSSI
jgi:hypothetical protein